MKNTVTLDHLDSSELLTHFVHKYNADLEQAESNEDKVELLEAKLAQSYAEFDQQQSATEQLKSQLNELLYAHQKRKDINDKLAGQLTQVSAEYESVKPMLLLAEQNSHKQLATQKELLLAKLAVTDLQKEVAELKGGENPKKMREQIKRIKEKSISDKKRIAAADQALKTSKRAMELVTKQLAEKDEIIYQLNKQLIHNQGSGLYHNGDHHLIIWPEKTRYQRPDGEIYEGRSLLYMHQSGRGGLVTYDPIKGEVYMCKAPKTGLRPSKETREFAKNWLYNVNELQDGVVHEKDMLAVNYNTPDSEPAVQLQGNQTKEGNDK